MEIKGTVAYCKQCFCWSQIDDINFIKLKCGHEGKVVTIDILGGVFEGYAINVKDTLEKYLWLLE